MDLTSPKTIKEICSRFNFTFSKGLGQNFLLDSRVLEKITEAAGGDNVIEIGPGFGCLTYQLAKAKEKVVTIELDKRLIPVLDYTLSEFDNVKIIENDILKLDITKLLEEEFKGKRVSVTANLPYYITTPIITKLLESEVPLEDVVVMVQKEVAERICAKAGDKDYGAITLFCGYYSEPEIVMVVPAESFMPPPKVDSAVLRLKMRKSLPEYVKDKKMFFAVVKAAFAQRRKTITNGLSNGLGISKDIVTEALNELGISPMIRGEKLSAEEFSRIADVLKEKM